MTEDNTRKRSRGYFKAGSSSKKQKNTTGANSSQKSAFRRKKYQLAAGMVGFLATLNDHQNKQATTELLNILPEFLPDLGKKEDVPSDGLSHGGDDVTALLAAENVTANLLQFCDTQVPNIIFIRLPPDLTKNVNMNNVACKIYQSIESSGNATEPRLISRYVNRLVPVIASCPAYLDRVTKCLRDTISSYFADLPQSELEQFSSFSLCFKSTYNQSIKQQEIEDILVCHMASVAPSVRLHRNARERLLVVGVHIVKTVCCVSLLKDYYKYAKYNLAEYQQKQLSGNEAVDSLTNSEKD